MILSRVPTRHYSVSQGIGPADSEAFQNVRSTRWRVDARLHVGLLLILSKLVCLYDECRKAPSRRDGAVRPRSILTGGNKEDLGWVPSL